MFIDRNIYLSSYNDNNNQLNINYNNLKCVREKEEYI